MAKGSDWNLKLMWVEQSRRFFVGIHHRLTVTFFLVVLGEYNVSEKVVIFRFNPTGVKVFLFVPIVTLISFLRLVTGEMHLFSVGHFLATCIQLECITIKLNRRLFSMRFTIVWLKFSNRQKEKRACMCEARRKLFMSTSHALGTHHCTTFQNRIHVACSLHRQFKNALKLNVQIAAKIASKFAYVNGPYQE